MNTLRRILWLVLDHKANSLLALGVAVVVLAFVLSAMHVTDDVTAKMGLSGLGLMIIGGLASMNWRPIDVV